MSSQFLVDVRVKNPGKSFVNSHQVEFGDPSCGPTTPTVTFARTARKMRVDRELLFIAAALCFAARGIERCRLGPNSDECIPSYCCPARVFLSGLGADELLRGYSRHRSAFSSQSPRPNSIEELQLDMERILRNRGRHDQTIAHHGQELDTHF
ncbi:hypothetical protein MJO28_004327 [Puccinia striiformis f. sp. tritici]|uniref:Uncharacterized protein n=1 Tax=Puccinia striiformis f. sp. tritici TaxID=168172 RepID=A0ACC0EQT4_9BASI|nr:hypothetical protein MJO28_004327 [Puccinia striiformis f. sp. tritici]